MKPILLIAESDAELRDAYRRFLTGCGYDVDTAADGLDCLEKLRRLTPAVLVLDRELRWGGADGVLAWLRDEIAASGISVVLTAGCPPEVGEDTEPPVVRFLRKPFALTALLESVRGLMASQGHEGPFHWNCASACPELLSADEEDRIMAQPAALLTLPTREPTGEETGAVQATARLLTQGLEDLRLAERVERALCAAGYGPLRGIEVTVQARLVTLSGRVPSNYLKQVAQTTALTMAGAQQVRNDLEVGRPN
jgi:DNA-binding response OmpR family regulator